MNQINPGGDNSFNASTPTGVVSPEPSITRLIGAYERNIDTKLRIGLPQAFREKLGDAPLILMRWLKKSLALFPECNWEPMAASIGRLDLYTDFGMTVRSQMFAQAREVKMDKEGRIIVPAEMAAGTKLKGKVMVVGDWDKITIWNPLLYEEQIERDEVLMNERFPAVMQLAKGQISPDALQQSITGKSPGVDG